MNKCHVVSTISTYFSLHETWWQQLVRTFKSTTTVLNSELYLSTQCFNLRQFQPFYITPQTESQAMSNIPVPLPYTPGAPWEEFEDAFKNYSIASELNKKPGDIQVATLKTIMGRECVAALKHIHLSQDDAKHTSKVLKALGDHFKPKINVVYERYRFNSCSQEPDEPIDNYVAGLRDIAHNCDYGNLLSDLIRDRLILGCRDNGAKTRLFREDDLTLERALTLLKVSEKADKELAKVKEGSTEKVSKLKHQDRRSGRPPYKPQTQPGSRDTRGSRYPSRQPPSTVRCCKFCGQSHSYDRESCPAWGKTCQKCGAANHLAIKCRGRRKPGFKRGKVHSLDDYTDEENDDDTEWISALDMTSSPPGPKDIKCNMIVSGKPVIFQVDSGATINVLPEKYAPFVEPTDKQLKTYNRQSLDVKGSCRTTLRNPKNGRKYSLEFLVVGNN